MIGWKPARPDLFAILALAVCMIVMAMFSRDYSRYYAYRSMCMSNLKLIGFACIAYAQDHGNFPRPPAPYTAGRALGCDGVWRTLNCVHVYFCMGSSKTAAPQSQQDILNGKLSYSFCFSLTPSSNAGDIMISDRDMGLPGRELGPYHEGCNHDVYGGTGLFRDGHATWVPGETGILQLQKDGADATAWNGTTGSALVN